MYTYTYVDVQTANLRLHMAAAGSKGGNSRQGNNRQGGQQAAGTRDSRRQGSSTRNSYRAAGRAVAAGPAVAPAAAWPLLPHPLPTCKLKSTCRQHQAVSGTHECGHCDRQCRVASVDTVQQLHSKYMRAITDLQNMYGIV